MSVNKAEVLAAAAADRDQYVHDIRMAESTMAQEEASANLARDRRIADARVAYRRSMEIAWLNYSSQISGKVST